MKDFILNLFRSIIVIGLSPILIVAMFSIVIFMAVLLLILSGGVTLVWYPIMQIKAIWSNNGSGKDKSSKTYLVE